MAIVTGELNLLRRVVRVPGEFMDIRAEVEQFEIPQLADVVFI